jgi:hypothetical protein
MLVHRPVNIAQESGPLRGHTSPYHERSATMLHNLLDMMRLEALSVARPVLETSVRAETVNLALARPNDPSPVGNGPVLVSQRELESRLDILDRQ